MTRPRWAVLVPLLVAIPNFTVSQAARGKSQPKILDVVVTDSTNRPVTNLGQQDFQVFENGKKQTIYSFLAPEKQTQPETQPVSPLPPNTFTNTNAFPPSSVEIVLLDQMNTSQEDQDRALRALRDSFTHKPPGAAFALFTLRSDDPACSPFSYAQQQFGIRSSSSAAMSDWSCLNRGQLLMIQGITQNKERLLAALDNDILRPRRAWLRSYPGSGRGGPREFGLPIPRGPDDVAPPEVYDTRTSALADLGEILHGVRGRKGLIWISDSFDAEPVAQYFGGFLLGRFKGWEKTDPLNRVQLLHLTTDRLSEDRVALYPANLFGGDKHVEIKFLCPEDGFIDPLDAVVASLNATPTQVTKQSMHWECSSDFMKLDTLAAFTGGKAISGAGAIQSAIGQAVSDDSTPYELVYFSRNEKFDGKVRKIRVAFTKNDKSGNKLAYRRTYFADDPTSIYPAHSDEQDVYITDASARSKFRVVRVSDVDPGQQWSGTMPLQASLQYGAPESNGIVFTVHVAPTEPFQTANAGQMKMLQNYPSFIPERVQKAVAAVSGESQWQRKGKATLDALPPIDPVFLQPYSIEFLLPPRQLPFKPPHDGDESIDLEIAVIAYDATGKRVNGLKATVHESIPAAGLSQFLASPYRFQQVIQIPDRVTVLRFAVRDVLNGRVGSLEVPIWTIASPYRRHRLTLPSLEEDDRRSGNQIPD